MLSSRLLTCACVQFVTGRGNHSESCAQLKPAIEKFLNSKGFAQRLLGCHKKSGSMTVRLGQPDLSTADTKHEFNKVKSQRAYLEPGAKFPFVVSQALREQVTEMARPYADAMKYHALADVALAKHLMAGGDFQREVGNSMHQWANNEGHPLHSSLHCYSLSGLATTVAAAVPPGAAVAAAEPAAATAAAALLFVDQHGLQCCLSLVC